MAHPQKGQYSAIKRKEADTCHGVEESQKHLAKRHKSDTKDYTLYESIYIRCPEQANPETERRLVVARGCVG